MMLKPRPAGVQSDAITTIPTLDEQAVVNVSFRTFTSSPDLCFEPGVGK